ncbi:uncharacterized protein N7479_007122 [Penicillium vulpinum]|uniref:BTB domain-containing protein n=1 Tax=Penicillium vulpinum TaxID=29845 RepID=A0A1V6S3M9_9EURO|nr:uncharacterized protein N7479_007122 [Penicillium vulpinum]KAJ5959972.1 hypothetical protein N7479_007122 [Penicillium vulpinum]OQE08329.1 hypothetical protein PENVUL_c010G04793 [Penicillium vulpinum]
MGFLFATPSDVTLIVIEEPRDNNDNKTKTALFHVDRSKLIDSSAYFRTMFSSQWERAQNHNPTLRGDTIKSMEVILRSIHGIDTQPESISVTDVWYIIKACNKYLLDPKKLMGWFTRWIKWVEQGTPGRWENCDFNRQLLFPCHFFDNATAFQHISKRLVYNTPGHITEMAPTNSPSFEPMHMPAIVMSQNIFSYLEELHRIEVKPLDCDIHKSCVRDILDRLKDFNENRMENRPPSMQTCTACSRSWKRVVEYARRQVESYFDDLCLDCMQNHPDENSEYWSFSTIRSRHDQTCRISHGEPTWYFSFMGRRDRSPYLMLSG